MKQEELAQRAGIGRAEVSDIERGVANPTWAIVRRLCDALGCSVAELAALEESERDRLGESMIELWTDGSGRAHGPGGWAYILSARTDDGEWVEECASGGIPEATHNRAELTALLEGLRALKRPCELTVYTDSKYVANPFCEGWFERWQQRGWRGIRNVDLWKQILDAAAPHRISAEWIPGHSGITLNERCDAMAGAERLALVMDEAAAR
jgi:ribonuclease HI